MTLPFFLRESLSHRIFPMKSQHQLVVPDRNFMPANDDRSDFTRRLLTCQYWKQGRLNIAAVISATPHSFTLHANIDPDPRLGFFAVARDIVHSLVAVRIPLSE